MIPDEVLKNRLIDLGKRMTPFGRQPVTLNSLYGILGDDQFNGVISALEKGELEANGCVMSIFPHLEKLGKDDEKISTNVWQEWELHLPNGDNSEDTVYLVHSPDEVAVINISLKSSDLNRHLELTGQAGGQAPKMGPKLFAFLAVWYSREKFITDPSELLSILEGRDDVWGKHGTIDGRRGMDTLTEYLAELEVFEAKFADKTIDLDTSFASER